MRRRLTAPACACLLALLAACAAQSGSSGPAPVAPTVPATATGAPPRSPDRSCAVAADCTVKNVGNCCGYFPACVNKDATVDPEAVRAECVRTGTSSVCGFRDIQACECTQGRCTAVTGPVRMEMPR